MRRTHLWLAGLLLAVVSAGGCSDAAERGPTQDRMAGTPTRPAPADGLEDYCAAVEAATGAEAASDIETLRGVVEQMTTLLPHEAPQGAADGLALLSRLVRSAPDFPGLSDSVSALDEGARDLVAAYAAFEGEACATGSGTSR